MRSEVNPHRRVLLAVRIPLCAGCKGAAGPELAKTSLQGRRKTVPGQILGCSCCNGEDSSRSENKIAAGPLGWAAASVAITPGAVAIQANSTWLVSGATVIQNFLKKSMPRKEPATAACKNLAVKSLP
jgi:hypothetical protein